MRTSLILALALPLALACGRSITIDAGEGEGELPALDGPTVEFDPGASVVPFPNNLLLDPTNGLVNLPEQCNETATATAIRAGILNTLDGFGTFKVPLSATFTEAVSAASLEGRVKLYRLATAGVPADPSAATEIPVVLIPGVTQRFDDGCDQPPKIIDNLTIVPQAPLPGNSTFAVALLSGITTDGGVDYFPSTTWSLVRQTEPPVVIEDGVIVSERTPFNPLDDEATLVGLDLLWNAHNGLLRFLDAAMSMERTEIVLAWSFNTQTTTDPLDASVADSPASKIPTDALASVVSLPDLQTGGNVPALIEFVLAQSGVVDACDDLPCDAVGDIVAGTFASPNYQSDGANPLPGGDPVPGPWNDPINPAQNGTETITALAFIPAPPVIPQEAGIPGELPTGFPVVFFGHGLTGQRENLFAIGSQLAAAGFIAVSIDWVVHGERAVQITNDPLRGCAGDPAFSAFPQCFAPVLSSDLAATRDNIRQSALGMLGAIEAVKACDAVSCLGIDIDPNRIAYMGQSLGSLFGALVVASSPDITAAVLNVGGGGWADALLNTDSLGIRCPVVDALIAGGLIGGELSNIFVDPPTGTCVDVAWRAEPGTQTFAVLGRWVLDSADGMNFAAGTVGKSILIQKVTDDAVVPNISQDQHAALIGAANSAADATPDNPLDPVPPSAAIVTDQTLTKMLTYTNLPANGGTGFVGNTYEHASLLRPSGAGFDGQLATVRMQTDAITYLVFNTPAP